jgi:uncharacterized protein YgbK (DUF1537 family)
VSLPCGQLSRAEAFAAIPPVWPEDLQPGLLAAARSAGRTLVVLDDDPTGTQTVYDVPVVTRWDRNTLEAEFRRELPCFYVLTNSRSLPAREARALHLELGRHLRQAAVAAGRAFTLFSRSDSTLREHFPVETDALAEVCGPFDATILAPYFEAGGRYTLDDVHFVAEGDLLSPAAETPFARDAVFGYRHSNLREWIEEKTAGRVRARDVQSLPVALLRSGGPRATTAALLALPRGCVCIANLCAPRDAEVLAAATLVAEHLGKKYLCRCAASSVSARLGLAPHPFLTGRAPRDADGGGIILIGSHVPQTSLQLDWLLASGYPIDRVELDVPTLLDASRRDEAIAAARERISSALSAGRDVVVFTSRRPIRGSDDAASLEIGRRVAEALVALAHGLQVRPRFIIAKGGITSSEIATRGLGVVRAVVRGQLIPGVPVWELGSEARFPGLNYVVFPGNVGGPESLVDALQKFGRQPNQVTSPTRASP